MSVSKSFTVVRELYSEKSGFFGGRKWPQVDDACENSYGMDKNGNVVQLKDGSARDAAAKRGDRIFAISKRHVEFSTVYSKVCKEYEYNYDFSLEGTISISNPAVFLCGWASNEGACGREGIDSVRFAHKILLELEPVVKDQIAACRREHGYSIADIREKDALPASYWSKTFANTGKPLLAGVSIEVLDKAFASPDREMEEKLLAAAEAQRKLEEQERREQQALINGKMAEAELEQIDLQRQSAKLAFEREQAELDNLIRQKKIELAIQQANQLNEAKVRLRKELNDEEIRKQREISSLKNEQVEKISQKMGEMSDKVSEQVTTMSTAVAENLDAMSSTLDEKVNAMAELEKRLSALADKLTSLGVTAAEAAERMKNAPSMPEDPTVAPRYEGYEGMSEQFTTVMNEIMSSGEDTIQISIEVERCADGYKTRDFMAESRKKDEQPSDGVLHLGDRMTLRLKCPRPGYLTLLNFGTSGNVMKMFPNPAFHTTNNYIENSKKVYMLPGELMAREYIGDWQEQGPVSSEKGLPERVVAILTDRPVEFNHLKDAEGISMGSNCNTQGRDFACNSAFDPFTMASQSRAKTAQAISSLLDLPDGSWCWGMVEAWVEA